MTVKLFNEQQEAYNKIIKVIERSRHRVLTFIYGRKGVGKSTIAKKIKENYGDDSEIISIDEIFNKEFIKYDNKEIQKIFLIKHTPEEFLGQLISYYEDKRILIINKLEYLLSNKEIVENIAITLDYDFGLTSNFLLNGKLIWILAEDDLLKYKNYWNSHYSNLNNSNFIKVFPPSNQTIFQFFNTFRKSDDITISQQEIEYCLKKNFLQTLKNRHKKNLLINDEN